MIVVLGTDRINFGHARVLDLSRYGSIGRKREKEGKEDQEMSLGRPIGTSRRNSGGRRFVDG